MNEKDQAQKLSEFDVLELRRKRLDEWRKSGDAYPNDFRRSNLSDEIRDLHEPKDKFELEEEKISVSVAGRVVLRRIMGKASFITLQDSGGRIQIYVRQDKIGLDGYEEFKKWDLGDIVGAVGNLMKTNKGELTVDIAEIRLLTKSLRPMPEKHKGLANVEKRYRQRYLDLMVNEKTRNIFQLRSLIISKIRQFFSAEGFLEVETPMLLNQPGGATALPFTTRYNALDASMYLRVAPELNLKRLIVGGFDKIFELNRNFRNEGVSTKHNPEFTMLEFYWAYADYNDAMGLTEILFKELAFAVKGSTIINFDGVELEFGKPFARKTMREMICESSPDINERQLDDLQSLRGIAERTNISVNQNWGEGKIVMELFEALVENKIQQPTFVIDHPAEVSPLARRKPQEPDLTERFELFIMGKEIANGFSELNDPEDQTERFQDQVRAKKMGDKEAMHFDHDYIAALEHGLPPTAGEGIGIDRLVMLLTDSSSIRDVLLFPQMKNKN